MNSFGRELQKTAFQVAGFLLVIKHFKPYMPHYLKKGMYLLILVPQEL